MKCKRIHDVNRFVLFILIVIGIVSLVLGFFDLQAPSDAFDAGQSRLEFRWGVSHTIFLVIIFMMAIPLALKWDRLFPYNTPFAMIICGFCYALIVFTFTIGWVGFVGLFGLAVSFFVGMVLLMIYALIFFFERRAER